MASYTVERASKKKDVPGQHGPMQVISLGLKEYGSADVIGAEWFTKAETPVPTPGQKLEGDVTPGEYGPRFKKAQAAGGFQRAGRSPEESRRIVRQHSQAMAIRWAEFAHMRGTLPEGFKLADLRAAIDFFHKDAMGGGQ